MKQKHIALLATVPVLLGLGSTIAFAQVGSEETSEFGRGGRFAEHHERMSERFAEELDLTEAQQIEIRAIREQSRAENEGLIEQMQQARQTMRSLMANNATNDQIRQQHNQVQQLQQQIGDAMLETRLEIREVLTNEQRSQLAEFAIERSGPGERFHGHRRGRF